MAFFVIWSRFRQLRRYLAYRPDASTGSLGHGPIHLLVDSALEMCLSCYSEQAGWIRPSLPLLRMMTGPTSDTSEVPFGTLGQDKVATDFCKKEGFRRKFCFDIYGSHQLLLVFSPKRTRQNVVDSPTVSGRRLERLLAQQCQK